MEGKVPWGLSTKPVVVPREGLDPAVTEPDDTEYVGLAVFGPRKDVDKLTGKLSLAGETKATPPLLSGRGRPGRVGHLEGGAPNPEAGANPYPGWWSACPGTRARFSPCAVPFPARCGTTRGATVSYP